MHQEEADVVHDIAKRLVDWHEAHQAACGSDACLEPINTIAFLAHVVGLRGEHVGRVRDCMAEYEAGCEKHKHRRN